MLENKKDSKARMEGNFPVMAVNSDKPLWTRQAGMPHGFRVSRLRSYHGFFNGTGAGTLVLSGQAALPLVTLRPLAS